MKNLPEAGSFLLDKRFLETETRSPHLYILGVVGTVLGTWGCSAHILKMAGFPFPNWKVLADTRPFPSSPHSSAAPQ